MSTSSYLTVGKRKSNDIGCDGLCAQSSQCINRVICIENIISISNNYIQKIDMMTSLVIIKNPTIHVSDKQLFFNSISIININMNFHTCTHP